MNIPVFRFNRKKVGLSFTLAVEAIQEGWSLVIFPEGTIPAENIPRMVPFKNGVFKIAKEVKVPIVPITFTTNHLLFSTLPTFLARQDLVCPSSILANTSQKEMLKV